MRPLRLKYARREFTAARNRSGVPEITAPTWLDALYGLGFLHALDRATQMLFSRAIALGRSAELIADRPELVETDRFFRRAGLYLKLERELELLEPQIVGQLSVYCQGVNDGMKRAGRSLPMRATGFRVSPWDETSILLLGNLLSFGSLAVGQQQNERLILELIHAGVNDGRMRELFEPQLDDIDFDLLRQLRISSQLSDEALELLSDLPRLAGSNAWAVGPQRSATGGALLASDPHLEVNRLPAVWYEAVLRWGDEYVMGATLPGAPLFAVARTSRLAWGVTYLKGDTVDYLIEDCRPLGHGQWQYRRADGWHDFQVRSELVVRKGGEAEPLHVLYNDQGTLDSDIGDGNIYNVGATEQRPGYYLSQSWIGQQTGTGQAIGVWLDLVQSQNAAQAMDVVRECPQPSLVWVFADRDGHIGLQGSGWVPRRSPHHSGFLPATAWDERNHWQGRLPSDVLPRIYDPPEGFVATANEDINYLSRATLISLPVPDYRKRRIDERLRQMPKATVEDMQGLQYDVVSLQARDLLDVFLPHLPDGDIKRHLAAWDCGYGPESREATLFGQLYRNVLLEIFGQEQQQGGIGWRRMLYLCSRSGYSIMVLTCTDRLLQKEHSLWWKDRDKGDLIRRAAERLNDESTEPWGKTNSFHFTNRFIGSERVGRALGFHSGELPMPGCHATPFQGHLLVTARRETTFAPSYHFVTDLSTDEAWTNLPGGPSESRFSPHYRSDIPLWREGRYKPLAGRK